MAQASFASEAHDAFLTYCRGQGIGPVMICFLIALGVAMLVGCIGVTFF